MFDLVALAVPVWTAIGLLTLAVLVLMGVVVRLLRRVQLQEETLQLHMIEAGAHSLFRPGPRR